jgi:hypothetical protein
MTMEADSEMNGGNEESFELPKPSERT